MTSSKYYKPKSNITSTYSVKHRDEADYLALRQLLSRQRISVGEYLVEAYRELDKDAADSERLRSIAWS